MQALDCRIQRLQPLGWDMNYHVSFGNRMMQRYGVGAPAWFYDEPDPLVTHAQLARIVTKRLPLDERLHNYDDHTQLLTSPGFGRRTTFVSDV